MTVVSIIIGVALLPFLLVGIYYSVRSGYYLNGQHPHRRPLPPGLNDGAYIDGFITAEALNELDKMFHG